MATTSGPSQKSHFIAILCGGTGPRLWPLSRVSKPKQFLTILSQNSLLEETINRSLKIVPGHNIYIVTNKKYTKTVSKILPKQIPAGNIISEPQKRNTLMAILYTSLLIEKKHPNPVITFLPSDHFIRRQTQFRKQVKLSYRLAKKSKSYVIFGVKPQFDNPSYGHIQVGKKTDGFYPVTKFIEKPDLKTIQKLSKGQKIYWNSGIYTIPVKLLLEEVQIYQPQYSLNILSKSPVIAYKKCPNLSIDIGISQHTKKLLMLESNFTWSDIGEWKTIFNLSKKDPQSISTLNPETQYVQHDSQNCLVSAAPDKLIGLVGVDNLAVIDTPDGLLICRLDQSLHVRDLIGKMVRRLKIKKYFLD